jgi:hypothetical protein
VTPERERYYSHTQTKVVQNADPKKVHASHLSNHFYKIFEADSSHLLSQEEFLAANLIRFDENGDAIAYTSYDADGQPTRSLLAVEPHYTPEEESVADNLRYEYDTAGNAIKCSVLGHDGMVMSEIIYTYDKHGNLIEQATYSLGRYPRTLTTKFTMSYDEYGNIIEYKEFSVGANIDHVIHTFEITYRN